MSEKPPEDLTVQILLQLREDMRAMRTEFMTRLSGLNYV